VIVAKENKSPLLKVCSSWILLTGDISVAAERTSHKNKLAAIIGVALDKY